VNVVVRLVAVLACCAGLALAARASPVSDRPVEHRFLLGERGEQEALCLVASMPQGVWEIPLSTGVGGTGAVEGRALQLCYCSDPKTGGYDASCVVLVRRVEVPASGAKATSAALDALVKDLTGVLEEGGDRVKDRPEPLSFRTYLKLAKSRVPLFGTSFSTVSAEGAHAHEVIAFSTNGRAILLLVTGKNAASKFIDGLALERAPDARDAALHTKLRFLVSKDEGDRHVCVVLDVPKPLQRDYPHAALGNRHEEEAPEDAVAVWTPAQRAPTSVDRLVLHTGQPVLEDLGATWREWRAGLGEGYTFEEATRSTKVGDLAVQRHSAVRQEEEGEDQEEAEDGEEDEEEKEDRATVVEFAVFAYEDTMWRLSFEAAALPDVATARRAAAATLDRVVATLRMWTTRPHR
jgi:hypothetical protein